MSISKALKGVKLNNKVTPIWKGPEEEGVTQSLLSKFIVCRERFKLLVVDGLSTLDRFNHRLGYGNMWHICEEHFCNNDDWEKPLKEYCEKLCSQYRMQQEEIVHWYNICCKQFPIYVEWYRDHDKSLNKTPIFQEEVFCVPYELRSGRVVKLKGKFDSVDMIKADKESFIILQENKTKGDIDELQIQKQLSFDLQTMFYLVALKKCGKVQENKIRGVRYNVVRRPLSGGKGTIRKHQPSKSNPLGETDEQFYTRLASYISDDPKYYFMRWDIDIYPTDYTKFITEFLDPCLDNLCWWWDFVTKKENDYPPPSPHYRTPYGIFNPITDGAATDLDEYLRTGSTVGLRKVETLFPELEGV